MGVYGNFLTVFPELMQTITVWTLKDHSDERKVRCIYADTLPDGIRRKKFTSQNTAQDLFEDAQIYVDTRYAKWIGVGDYFRNPNQDYMMRVVAQREYNYAAGYIVFNVERVGGTTPDQTGELKVKEAYFA